jgi:para-nitrobenzyl esterase
MPPTEIIVKVAEGLLQGHRDEVGYRFLGVPFAMSPQLSGRFAPPIPHPPWAGTRKALAYGATASQPDQGVTFIPEPTIPGDNCLNLNIFTPDLGDAQLPVLVWIHGGGFLAGCNASPWYSGTSFARDGVVFVSVNYRLGAEGFMALADAPANRGVLDWIAALRWVQRNIPAFGGDPGRVTIAGQSAGAAACATLLAVPEARELFGAAICMSGAARFAQSADAAAAVGQEIAARLGVSPAQKAMEAVPVTRLLQVQQEIAGRIAIPSAAEELGQQLRGIQLRLAPVVDGDILPVEPLTAIRSGSAKDKAILVGTTAHEFNSLVSSLRGLTADVILEALVVSGLTPPKAESYLTAHQDAEPWEIAGQVLTDHTFRLPAQELLEAHASAGGSAYHYEFRWTSAALYDGFRWTSAAPYDGLSMHCLDVPFAFDLLHADGVEQAAGSNPPQELAAKMHADWVRFTKERSPGWAPYDERERTGMIYGANSAVSRDPLAYERSLWLEP